MENKNVVIVKHHPRPITLANSFYTTQCPDIGDRIVINLTSRNPDRTFAQQVSPFYVGPVTGPDGASADSLEVFWQVGKVFEHHDDNGQPSEAYFKYRNDMYSKKQGEIPKPIMRHPYREFGYEADDMLYWAYWNAEKGEYECLSYLEGRKKVYVPEYAKLVAGSDALKWMKSLVDQDNNKTGSRVHEERCHTNRNHILYNPGFKLVDAPFEMDYKVLVRENLKCPAKGKCL